MKGVNRNVVCICLDNVRADVFKDYNSNLQEDIASPIKDTLGDLTSIRCYSTSSWCGPAIASFFTGKYPSEISATLDVEQWHQVVLPYESPISVFPYRYCFTANMRMHSAFKRFFSYYVWTCRQYGTTSLVASLKEGSRIVRRVQKLQGELVEPFFVYIHLMDAFVPVSVSEYNADYHLEYMHGVKQAIKYATECLQCLKDYDPLVVIFSDHGCLIEDNAPLIGVSLSEKLVRVPLFTNYDPGIALISLKDLLGVVTSLVSDKEVSYDKEVFSQVITLDKGEQLVAHVASKEQQSVDVLKTIYNVSSQRVAVYDVANDCYELSDQVGKGIDMKVISKMIKHVVPPGG